jgi:hypothetical protein
MLQDFDVEFTLHNHRRCTSDGTHHTTYYADELTPETIQQIVTHMQTTFGKVKIIAIHPGAPPCPAHLQP